MFALQSRWMKGGGGGWHKASVSDLGGGGGGGCGARIWNPRFRVQES